MIQSAENPELSQVISLKPGPDQNTEVLASHAARSFSLSIYCLPNPFNCNFTQTFYQVFFFELGVAKAGSPVGLGNDNHK